YTVEITAVEKYGYELDDPLPLPFHNDDIENITGINFRMIHDEDVFYVISGKITRDAVSPSGAVSVVDLIGVTIEYSVVDVNGDPVWKDDVVDQNWTVTSVAGGVYTLPAWPSGYTITIVDVRMDRHELMNKGVLIGVDLPIEFPLSIEFHLIGNVVNINFTMCYLYEVIFDTGRGAFDDASKLLVTYVREGTLAVQPDDPELNSGNYVFGVWNPTPAGTWNFVGWNTILKELWDFDVIITNNVTLYAEYTEDMNFWFDATIKSVAGKEFSYTVRSVTGNMLLQSEKIIMSETGEYTLPYLVHKGDSFEISALDEESDISWNYGMGGISGSGEPGTTFKIAITGDFTLTVGFEKPFDAMTLLYVLLILITATLFFLLWIREKPAIIGRVVSNGKGLADVEIRYTVNGKAVKKTVVTDQSGRYSISVKKKWDVTVMPVSEEIAPVSLKVDKKKTEINFDGDADRY
ncbi:MAG: hypothetical protein FWD37_05985, partial [Methanomassiliicoccaceae archaeon]|nr:hypothetical protein [Methanomassiliicoccaceae archaeon]